MENIYLFFYLIFINMEKDPPGGGRRKKAAGKAWALFGGPYTKR